MLRVLPLCLAMMLALPAGAARAQSVSSPILDEIRGSQKFVCGTIEEADDSFADEIHGDLSALGADVCRAVSMAILGTVDGLTIANFATEAVAIAALRGGNVQLAVGLSPSVAVAAQFGFSYGTPVFYDSQRVMVRALSGMTALEGLRNKLVCTYSLSPPEQTLRDAMTARRIPYGVQSHSEQGELDASVLVGRCDAGTGTETRLAESRAGFPATGVKFVFLPERLSLDPVVPAYRHGDQKFGLVVDWTLYALLQAEALGITKASIAADRRRGQDVSGGDPAVAKAFGLAPDWVASVLETTGNYAEMFERDVGKPYHLDRGLNALWTNGGLMRPFPLH